MNKSIKHLSKFEQASIVLQSKHSVENLDFKKGQRLKFQRRSASSTQLQYFRQSTLEFRETLMSEEGKLFYTETFLNSEQKNIQILDHPRLKTDVNILQVAVNLL